MSIIDNMKELNIDLGRKMKAYFVQQGNKFVQCYIDPHPHYWSRDDVTTWAEWCRREFSLEMKVINFNMNGKALCMLNKEDFKERAPEAGDVLYNTLETLLLRASAPEASRWRSPLHLGHAALPLDLVVPPSLGFSSLYQTYRHPAITLYNNKSPPTSPPVGMGFTGCNPASPPAALPSPQSGFSPWDHHGSHQRSPKLVPLSTSPKIDQQNMIQSRDSWEQNEEATDYTKKPKQKDEDVNVQVPDKQIRSQSPQITETKASPVTLEEKKRISPIGRNMTLPPLNGDIYQSQTGVAVYENQPQTYHVVKAEPKEDPRFQPLHTHHPVAPPYDHISPPSSPDSQVLPSPVEQERVSPQDMMEDGSLVMHSENDRNNGTNNWSNTYPNSVPYIKGSRKLWEFLWSLMENPSTYKHVIRWEDKSQGIFRILNTGALAQLWGRQKNKNNMTYEKMSRALRYYYKMNILNKVPGKRLTYRFANDPNGINDMKRWARISGKSVSERVEMDR